MHAHKTPAPAQRASNRLSRPAGNSARPIGALVASGIALALASGAACASEDLDLRYAPGIGGAEMSAPFEPGWVFQLATYAYSGKIASTTRLPTDLTQPPFSLPIAGASATTTAQAHSQVNVFALLPRISYMSSFKVLGATVGGSILVPLARKHIGTSLDALSTSVDAAGLPAATQAYLAGEINQGAHGLADELTAANTGSVFGLGDVEISSLLCWGSDHDQLIAALSVTAPTGEAQPRRPINQSQGQYWTVRPGIQYGYIGDGWDFGSRLGLSINTRDRTTRYRSGDYIDVDLSLMKSVTDSLRIGLASYGFVQTTRDTLNGPPVDAGAAARQALSVGRRGHVFAAGPAIAYLGEGGTFMIDGHFEKEFDAVDRPNGTSFFLTLTRPF